MSYKGFINFAAGVMLVGGALATPALAQNGVSRNQAALGVAGHVTPALKACAQISKSSVRTQCAMGGASQFQDESDSNDSTGTYIVGAAALAAVVAGIIVVASDDNNSSDASPPPPVSS